MELEIVNEKLKMGFEACKIRHCVERLETKPKFVEKAKQVWLRHILIAEIFFFWKTFNCNVWLEKNIKDANDLVLHFCVFVVNFNCVS